MNPVRVQAIAELTAASNAPVDLREALQRMTLEIAGRTMFSFEIDKHGPALRGFVNEYGERLAQPRFFDLLLQIQHAAAHLSVLVHQAVLRGDRLIEPLTQIENGLAGLIVTEQLRVRALPRSTAHRQNGRA